MTQPGLIDRRGLLNWADSIGARSELPRLIRRLILETGKGVVELGFPAGEGVAAASWDGTVRASEDALYVPSGLSLWELSVEKSPGAKADDDYAKRTSTPDGSPTADAIYVAVSLRPWLKRGEWAQGKSGDGRWKAVRALGVDDVDTWLESAHEVAALRGALSAPGRLLTVRASSRDEVAAFVASLALSEEATDGGALLARTAFVDDVEAWRRLREHPTPLVVVALTEGVAAEFAADSAHVLVVPLTGTTDADVELPPIDSLAAAQVLKDAGLPERAADDAGKLARLRTRTEMSNRLGGAGVEERCRRSRRQRVF